MKNKKKIFSQKNTPQSFFLLVTLIILGLIFYYSKERGVVHISEKQFENMMLQQEVESVTLITNQRIVEVVLKESALKREMYQKDLVEKSYWNNFTTIVYTFKIPSFKIFDKNFKEIEKKNVTDRSYRLYL